MVELCEGLKIPWPLRLCGFKSRFEYDIKLCESMIYGAFLYVHDTVLLSDQRKNLRDSLVKHKSGSFRVKPIIKPRFDFSLLLVSLITDVEQKPRFLLAAF